MVAMRKVAPILVLRLALLVAVLACAVLFVEYENAGDPAFCGAGSGCMAVRRSMFSHIVLYDGTDVSLPVLGLCAVAGLLALAVVARDKSQTFFVAAAAAGGGLVALVLVGIQAFVIGAFCKWCLLVDGSMVVAAVAAALVHSQAARDPAYEAFLLGLSQRRVQVVAWLAGAAIVGGLPFLWGEYPVLSPLPAAIERLSVPGKVTIVSFTDFECPFCRKLAPVLHEVQENWGDRVVLVRRMAPLSIHPGALPAALAYVCAPAASREDMARRLYAAPPTMLTRGALPIIARDAGLDQAAFESCMDGAPAHDQVAADRALFDSLDAQGVPYTFIGPRAVAGFNPEAVRKYGARVTEGEQLSLHLSWMLLAALVVAALLTALTLRSAPRDATRLAPA
jgi:thiol-disulfide isomerase/thioredoxin